MINQEYQQQIQAMHAGGKFNNGAKQFKLVVPFLDQYHPRTLLDFGCGKGALIDCIHEHYPAIQCIGYDPGHEEFNRMPDQTFDAVISTDAIEHIEPEHLADTLRLIASKIERCAFFRIACHPARKRLPDGRNCHLIVEEPSWWREQIRDHMRIPIVWERIEVFDKREKNPILFGSKYDMILDKS
jgi:cyclopropane fatty-acyl-phospholipid synthase-like methyltransferase